MVQIEGKKGDSKFAKKKELVFVSERATAIENVNEYNLPLDSKIRDESQTLTSIGGCLAVQRTK